MSVPDHCLLLGLDSTVSCFYRAPNEPPHHKTNKMTCATSEDSDQTERIWESTQSNQSLCCLHEETDESSLGFTLGPDIIGCPRKGSYMLKRTNKLYKIVALQLVYF